MDAPEPINRYKPEKAPMSNTSIKITSIKIILNILKRSAEETREQVKEVFALDADICGMGKA